MDATTIDRLSASPAFASLADKALANDRAESDAQRKTAADALAELDSEHAARLSEIDHRLAAAKSKVTAAERVLKTARDRCQEIHAEHHHTYWHHVSAHNRLVGEVCEHAPQELAEFRRELCDLADVTRSAGVRSWRTGAGFLGLLSGTRRFKTESNVVVVRTRLTAIQEAGDEVDRLSETFLPYDEVLTRIRTMRESIPTAD